MAATFQANEPRPHGTRMWFSAVLLVILSGIVVGYVLTRPSKKAQYNYADLREDPNAASWAHEMDTHKSLATPAPTPQPAHQPRMQKAASQTHEHYIPPSTQREVRHNNHDEADKLRFLAQADGSPMEVKVPGSNVLEIDHQPKSFSPRQGRPLTIWGNTWLNAVLDTAINSDRPGDVTAHISTPVRDSLTQTVVLIPAGSILHGMVRDTAAAHSVNLNNDAVTVSWDSLILPNGADIALPMLPSADVDGLPGLSDKVDRHALQKWGPAILTSAITAAAMLSTTSTYGSEQGYSPTSVALGAFGTSLGQKSLSNLNDLLGSVRPTIEIRKGTAIRILVREPGLPFLTGYEE